MGSDTENHNRIFVLTRENHEKWFRKVQFKAQAKGYFYVVEISKEKFAWISKDVGPASRSQKPTELNANSSDDPLGEVISKIEKLGGSWNVEKSVKYAQDTAKLFSYLTDCLSDEDQAILDEFDSA
ncbi:hypothetical protein OnM2_076058 [Erysiphe neolycopersici]|uniref:Uncharacterized protein n=1 Tax=Erysiphe neolycopersici TaxID=212602 RepID=A0A420HI64_9PEZI|nr:hypothetical protein OnM2_076058 [Erysiphe neolycopersici]